MNAFHHAIGFQQKQFSRARRFHDGTIVPRPNEHGPGKARDITPARQWDVIASDFEDLATKLGC